MHGIRGELADLLVDPPEIPHQRDFRVARAGQRAEILRRQHAHHMPERLQLDHQRPQTGGHATHPRLPGIADDQQPHA
ncbi:hypothetical protein D3C76_1762770 [compost metagenome]